MNEEERETIKRMIAYRLTVLNQQMKDNGITPADIMELIIELEDGEHAEKIID